MGAAAVADAMAADAMAAEVMAADAMGTDTRGAADRSIYMSMNTTQVRLPHCLQLTLMVANRQSQVQIPSGIGIRSSRQRRDHFNIVSRRWLLRGCCVRCLARIEEIQLSQECISIL